MTLLVMLVFALQLVGPKADEGAVHSHLWIPELHTVQLKAFLESASIREPQVAVPYLSSTESTKNRLAIVVHEAAKYTL